MKNQKHRSVHKSVYPLSYDKNRNANPATFTKNFNNWARYVQAENHLNQLKK